MLRLYHSDFNANLSHDTCTRFCLSRSRKSRVWTFPIAVKFGRQLVSWFILWWLYWFCVINTLRQRHFADDTFKRIFLNQNVRIFIKNSLKFVPKDPMNNIPILVQINHYLNQLWLDYRRIYASLGLNELIVSWHTDVEIVLDFSSETMETISNDGGWANEVYFSLNLLIWFLS